jgi:hypothetical protein
MVNQNTMEDMVARGAPKTLATPTARIMAQFERKDKENFGEFWRIFQNSEEIWGVSGNFADDRENGPKRLRMSRCLACALTVSPASRGTDCSEPSAPDHPGAKPAL